MGKNRFTVIDHQTLSADPDGNSGVLTRSLDMYEVSTAKVLKGEATDTSGEVFYAFHGHWFVIAISSDIHFFDISVGCTEFNPDSSKGRIEGNNKNIKDKRIFILPDEAHVVALQFIPTTDVLLILLSNGTAFFGSSTKRFSYQLKDAFTPIEKCAMCIVKSSEGEYSVAISDCKGTIHFLTITQFDAGFHDDEHFRRVFSAVQKYSCDVAQTIGSVHFIASIMNSFVFFPKRKGAAVYASSFLHLSGCAKFTPLFALNDDVQMVRTVGYFVCVLKNNSQLAFFDQNLVLLHVMSLMTKEDENCTVLDFEFLDVGEYCEFSETVKILLKVRTERGIEFKIKQFNEVDSQFSRQCSEHAVLVSFSTPGDENNIIYIDAFPHSSPSDIFLRFVGEAQPALRLKKLIELKRFDDALAFAKSYSLPADLVYVELLLFYQEQIQNAKDGSYEEETFSKLLNTLRMLSDHNTAGDHCVAVLNFVTQYEHIKTILDFAKSLKITDLYTQKDIARFRYELASYRMLFELHGPRFDRESPWPQFLSSGSHKEFFDGFCEAGQMAEARLLLSRYFNIAQELHDEKSMRKLLTIFKSTLTEKPQISGEISEFVEVELIPIILNSNNLVNTKKICSTFCDFFVDVSLLLEKLEPKKFPHASLHFAETFNRAIDLLRADCHTADKHVTFLHILRQLDDGDKEGGILGRLYVLIQNLKRLCKIHTVYACTMSYSEFLSHDVNTICHRIMDRIRTTTSVREIVEQFVFPYVEEHGLDRNKVLYDYIKQIASSYHSCMAGQAHTWDLLCLQITEQITDANVRCRAIVEIASGAVPPWSPQLSKIVRAVIAQGDKIDPELINSLRKQCLYADLGLIFIRYEIPLSNRSRVIGGAGLRSLLQYIFKNSRRDMALKLQDAFRVVELYEDLQSRPLFSAIDCYYLYAVVLIKQLTDENEMKSLTDLFQLIKSPQEAESVALKLITHLKCLLKPTKIKAIVVQRLVWLACLLCVAERYLHPSFATKLIRDARAIRHLQTGHQLMIGFSTFREKDQCIAYLKEFIDVPSAKSIVQVHAFGALLCLDLKDTCKAIIGVHIKNGLPDAALDTLRYMTSSVQSPTKAHLIIALDTCTFVCWKLTESVKDEFANEDIIEFSKSIMHAFQSVLPKLIDWSVSLEESRFFESFSKISRYVFFFNLVLSQCASNDDMPKRSPSDPSVADISVASVKSLSEGTKCANQLYTVKARTGVLLPHLEGTLYNTVAVAKAVSEVASSVVESPVDAKLRDEFHEQMRESWDHLFDHLSGSHILLEIQARKLANTLDCFASTNSDVLLGIEQHVLELCKKIFNFPIADVQLAAHLLLSLPADEMRKNLQELRRWVQSRKNVRYTLNLISVSLFVLIVANQDSNIIKQVVSWHETTQWQKRLVKHNVNMGAKQLKRDNIYELIGELAKVLLPSSFLYEYCTEANCAPPAILLNYAVELCKLSSTLTLDASRFELCIETAKAAILSVDMDERTVMVLMMTVKDICPYNYEAIELLFNTMHEIVRDGKIGAENSDLARIKDGYMLLKFLRCTSRGKRISAGEIRWFKQFINQKSWNASLSYITNTELISSDETAGAPPRFDESTMGSVVREQSNLLPSNESNSILPKSAAKRLPFHLLFNEENETDKCQSKLIYHELTIFNFQHWTSLIEETVSILQHSRSHLLVGSISNHVNESVKFKRELCDDDLCQIKQLICDYPRLSILKALASRFQRLTLSQTKISLMKLCCEVIEEWLCNYEDEELRPKEARIACESYSSALRESLVVTETEFLLANNGLLNTDTVSLTQKSHELVNYLLCRSEMDWAEKDSIAHCFEIIDAISQIHSVDVEDVFLALIDRWIIECQDHSEQAISQMSSDPDSTIDFTGPSALSNPPNSDESEFFVPVLYDAVQTTRIIVLLRRIKDPMKKILEFSHKSEIDVSVLPGGYMTKIRIACCILRFMTDGQMRGMFNITIDQFYGNFVIMLNQRLYSLCRIDLPIKDLKEADKRVEFVRIILSPQSVYRQTPEIARLLVCLIIDNDIDDLTILGKAAQRLVQLRLSTPLLELLKYLRNIKGKDIRTIPSISTFFAKSFEAFFDKIDAPNARKELASLVLFLISCPVEGDGHFARSVSLLASTGANFASSLVAISDNSTAEVNLVDEKSKVADLFGGI